MRRKIEIKKLDDLTKRQVTFSKRRTSLMKKAQEIAFLCDVDVLFVAFSPAGRLHKFCSKARIEDVLQLYINLPTELRLTQMKNLQEKLEKLRQLDYINGDNYNKLDHLEKQVENLEVEIRNRNCELEFMEANLCEYEPSLDLKPSWHQLSWCEKNLMRSLKRVMARNDELFGSSSSSWSQHNMQNSLANPLQAEMVNQGQRSMSDQNSPSFIGRLLKELDPWISPYSAKVRASMFEHLIDEARGEVICKEESVNPVQGKIIGDSTTYGVQQQNLPPILEQGEQVHQNAPLGFQQHQIGHYVSDQNGQDSALLLNQLSSNQRQLLPLSSEDSNIPLRIESGSGSRGFESHQMEFGWEMPQSKDKHHITELECLLPDHSSHSALTNSQSLFHPYMDRSLVTVNEVSRHEVGDFSRAFHQLDQTPQVHEPQGGINQWTSRNQNNEVLGWNKLIEELFSD